MHREFAMDIGHAAVLMHPPLLVMPIFRRQCRCALARRLFLCPFAQLASRRKGRKMKIKYQFISEATEIKASDDWGDIFFELDHQEYNINYKETRHHCSLEAYNVASTPRTSVEAEDVLLSEKNREQLFAERIKIFSRVHPLITWLLDKVFLVILIDIIANMTYCAIGQALSPVSVCEKPHSFSQVIYHIELKQNVVMVEDAPRYHEVEVQDKSSGYRYTGNVSKESIFLIESEAK